ncbi:hypothetical protein scyTo_0012702 [Scyliorhinus torazame]|uniref:Uncharacterized protein n=1 Tax=Scyliorhinus torazame TaxID=75743 RepID=A0A401NH72_SCYTO|nr:hypothetical protein [Scyliorhinus torazame]
MQVDQIRTAKEWVTCSQYAVASIKKCKLLDKVAQCVEEQIQLLLSQTILVALSVRPLSHLLTQLHAVIDLYLKMESGGGNASDDIDAMFSDLLGEMDLLTQNITLGKKTWASWSVTVPPVCLPQIQLFPSLPGHFPDR